MHQAVPNILNVTRHQQPVDAVVRPTCIWKVETGNSFINCQVL